MVKHFNELIKFNRFSLLLQGKKFLRTSDYYNVVDFLFYTLKKN